jgi:hypothetical protein
MTAAMALVLQLAFSFLDYFAYPESFVLFFTMRSLVNLVLIAILVRGRSRPPVTTTRASSSCSWGCPSSCR